MLYTTSFLAIRGSDCHPRSAQQTGRNPSGWRIV